MKVNHFLHFHNNNTKRPNGPPQPNFLDQLPNDLLLYALQQFDIPTLHTLSHVSQRLRSIVGIVLSYYTLPQVRLSTLIHQEGRSLLTTYYYFKYFDTRTFTAVFQVADPTWMKRYRMDGQTDAPRLRSLSMLISSQDIMLYKLNKPLKRGGTVYYYSSSLLSSSYTLSCWSFSYCIFKNAIQLSLCPNTIRIQLACLFHHKK
ncbi:hypothetical protein K501DRAFT_332890 [Backusella circina FSU 941]|nr:hypothetical protein K501DRAFT_332890 [Backusella circina FSU 941]